MYSTTLQGGESDKDALLFIDCGKGLHPLSDPQKGVTQQKKVKKIFLFLPLMYEENSHSYYLTATWCVCVCV